jgi:hypothetical protein
MSNSLTIPFSEIPRQKNTPAFVIGNGIGRKDLDLNQLRNRGIIFGCNYIVKDYDFSDVPHFIGTQDQNPLNYICMHTQFLQKGGNLITPDIIAGRPDLKYVPRRIVVKNTSGSTGHMMLNCARHLGCDPIVLIGIADPFKKVDGAETDNIYGGGINGEENGHRVYTRVFPMNAQRTKTNIHWPQEYVKILAKITATVVATNPDNILQIPAIPFDELCDMLPARYGCKPIEVSGVSCLLPTPLD